MYATVLNPVSLGKNITGANALEVLNLTQADTQVLSLRQSYNADLVVLFTGQQLGDCGLAYVPTLYSPDRWNPELELSWRNSAWASIVSTPCFSTYAEQLGAHEISHHLGAGHTYWPPGKHGLFLDSHGDVSLVWEGEIGVYLDYRTILHNQPCAVWEPCCIQLPFYSANPGSGRNNMRTMLTMALSVANYNNPPPLMLNKPTSITGNVVNSCIEISDDVCATQHYIAWNDGGTNYNPADVFYEVWGAQPIGSAYDDNFYTSAPGSPRDAYIYVGGQSGSLKIKTCTAGTGCSALSDVFYTASYLCP